MSQFKARFITYFMLATLLFSSSLASPAAVASAGASPASSSPSSGPAAAPAAVDGILSIPLTESAPKVDGFCTDYAGAVMETFVDGNGNPATVYLVHTADNVLYVCMQAQPGALATRFGSLYLDPQGDGASYVFAQKDDYALHVGILDKAKSSYHGTGVVNGYEADATIPPFWDGVAVANAEGESVEYQVSTGRFMFGANCSIFGIAVYHHWFSAIGDDYGWPSNRYFDQPRTWQLAQLDNGECANSPQGRIAYVFRGNSLDATSFYNLLTGAGYSVDLVPLGSVLSTDFTQYTLVLIANDTGNLNQWGFPSMTAAQVAKISAAKKPVIGLGEGGYAYFGQSMLFIGWPNGWHGPQQKVDQAPTAPAPYFMGLSPPIQHYTSPKNSVGIYLGGSSIPSDVIPVGLEDPTPDHASLIMQGCDLLWGNSGNPLVMTVDGITLFLNAVQYMNVFQCPTPQPPPPDCVTITKTAVPADGTPVVPGQVISYTVTYTYSDDAACENPKQARLVELAAAGHDFRPGQRQRRHLSRHGRRVGLDHQPVRRLPIEAVRGRGFRNPVRRPAPGEQPGRHPGARENAGHQQRGHPSGQLPADWIPHE